MGGGENKDAPFDSVQANADPGHGLFLYRANDNLGTQRTLEFMQQHTPDAPSRLGELRGAGQLDPIAGTVFPNLSFNLMSGIPNLRMWMPKGSDKMEVWTWGIVDAGLPDEIKTQMYRNFQFMFGVGGVVEQDDGINGKVSRRCPTVILHVTHGPILGWAWVMNSPIQNCQVNSAC